MSILGIVILLIVITFALLGMRKGLVRKVSGILSLVISCVLVNFMLPTVTKALKEQTPVYGYLTDGCRTWINDNALSLIPKDMLSSYASSLGIPMEQMAQAGQSVQDIRNALAQAGYDTSNLGMKMLSSLTRQEQTSLIRQLPVPSFLQEMMESYNNSEGYSRLKAADFGEYIISFAADLILNAAALVLTLLVTWVIVRLIIGSLNLFSSLPLLGTADRMGGLLCGALEGLFVVWFILLIGSLLSGTLAGAFIQEQIDKSLTLWPVAESNVFMKIISNAVSNML